MDPYIVGSIAGVIVVAIVAAVILVSTHHHAPRRPTGSVTTPTAATTTAPAKTTPVLPPVPPATAKRQVIGVLHRYATAFTHHSLPALAAIFSSNVTRRGLTSTGCTVSRGQQAVLNAYASEFGGSPGAYELPDLSPAQVHLSGSGEADASVSTSFTIASSDRGGISFQLNRDSGHWLITHISAKC